MAAVALGAWYVTTTAADAILRDWLGLDSRRMLEAGRTFLAGNNPYDIVGYVYSPVATLMVASVAWLPTGLIQAAWLVLNLALVAAVFRIAGAPWLAAIAFLAYLPVASDLILGNVTVLLTGAAWLAISNRSGIPLGIAAAAFPKPFVIPLFVWLVVHRRRRARETLVGGLASGLAALVLAGPDDFLAFAGQLVGGGGFSHRFSGNIGLSLISPELWLFGAALGVAVLLWLVRDEVLGLGAASVAGLLIAPWAGLYAGVPLILALPSLARAYPRTAWGLTAGAIACAGWLTMPFFALIALMSLLLLMIGQGRRGRAAHDAGATAQVSAPEAPAHEAPS